MSLLHVQEREAPILRRPDEVLHLRFPFRLRVPNEQLSHDVIRRHFASEQSGLCVQVRVQLTDDVLREGPRGGGMSIRMPAVD